MALGYVATLRNAQLQEIQIAADAGSGAGLLRIYDGTRPATGAAITSQVLLAELTLSDPSAPAASAGVLTLSAITQDSSANATGTATWFRIVDSNSNVVLDGNVGTSGSDLNLTTTSIVITQPVSITSFTITAGNA
jgi:hypothetical protein